MFQQVCLAAVGALKAAWRRPLAVAGAVALLLSPAAQAQDYRQAYVYALRCVVVANSAKDEAGARRAFDTAMRLGRLQNLSNRQLNDDLAEWGATELTKIVRDPAYKAQMMAACRKLGLAS